MSKIFALLFAGASVAVAACAVRPTYSETLQPWIGQSEEKLYAAWGMPYNVIYPAPGAKVVYYMHFSYRPENGMTNPYAYEVAYPAIATPDYGLPGQPQSTNYYCQTHFTIRNGVVTDFGFNGDDCVVSDN